MQPPPYPPTRLRRASLGVAAALAASVSGGCHQSAYTELYVQQLNNEARQLEDRVYEYDAAYRRLETELDVLQHDNARLRAQLVHAERDEALDRGRSPSSGRLRESIEGRRNAPGSEAEAIPLPRRVDPTPGRPGDAPDVDGRPSPSRPPGPDIPDPFEAERRADPPPPIDDELVPPSIEFGVPPGALLQPQAGGFSDVESIPAGGRADGVVRVAGGVSVDDVSPVTAAAAEVADGETLVAVRPAATAVAALPRDLEDVDQFRIQVAGVDVEEADASDGQETADDASAADGGLVVDLSLHPAFTRGLDADGDGLEEGLRVLVQPKTQAGAVAAVDGELTVVAVDTAASTARPDDPKRLGRWTFTAAELEQLYDPIGSAAGYHLQFTPLAAPPASGQVTVFVRLELPDGRKLVNRTTLALRTQPGSPPVWTPRVSAK